MNPWVSRKIIHMKRQLRRMRAKRKSSKQSLRSADVTTLSLSFRAELADAKKRYMNESLTQFIKTAPQKFWRYLSKEKSNTVYLNKETGTVTDSFQLACTFNDYFKSVFTDDDGILPEFSLGCPASPIPDIVVTQEGICNLLLNLDEKKSTGLDGIPNVFLKRYAEWCSCYLTDIFNKSLRDGQVPNDWKCAKVIPIHKGGAKDCVNNYRPVSLTSTCCKTLEHVLTKHLTEFLEEHKLMAEQQHGFRRGFSTVTILTEVSHFISQILDDRGQVDIIFLDFRKAFDKIPHPKLLHKLSTILQNDELINWIAAYLINREQVVCIRGTNSTSQSVGSGVPQGSVIGPLLFLLYINDMNSGFSPDVFIKHYADDTVIYSKAESNYDQEKLNEHLGMIGSWCKKWQMVLNPSKTVFMPITRKTKPLLFRYVINDEPLCRVSEYKYLGVYVTDSLNWNRHIDYICDKSQKKALDASSEAW